MACVSTQIDQPQGRGQAGQEAPSGLLPAPMAKQVSSLNTAWLIVCLRRHHPELDLDELLSLVQQGEPFSLKNLENGRLEPLSLHHLESADYWFSNRLMMALYTAIEELLPDPGFAYLCGSSFYQSQSCLKTAIGVPLIGPYRLTERLVRENDKYNRTKEALIRSMKRGHIVIRLIHRPDIIMKEFGMEWHRGVFESYARLAGVSRIQSKLSCIEAGPREYGEPGQAIYDFELTFQDPGFRQRIWTRLLSAVPTVAALIRNTELIQAEHNREILSRERIIREKSEHLVNIQKRLMDAERQNIEQRLRNLSTELVTTEERERRALAEDLHDSVSQLLALGLSGLRRHNRKTPGQEDLLEVEHHLQTALEETRSLTFQISPPVLYDFGLEAALEWLVKDTSTRHNLEMDFLNLLDEPLKLNEHQRVTLYRSVREGVINCIKHARAGYASVVLTREKERHRIEIEDNGSGFDIKTMKRGFGLSTLGDRLENIGASMEISSTPGEGTRLDITLPRNGSCCRLPEISASRDERVHPPSPPAQRP